MYPRKAHLVDAKSIYFYRFNSKSLPQTVFIAQPTMARIQISSGFSVAEVDPHLVSSSSHSTRWNSKWLSERMYLPSLFWTYLFDVSHHSAVIKLGVKRVLDGNVIPGEDVGGVAGNLNATQA